MRLRGWGTALTFALAWVVNPAFVTGCGATYDFDEARAVALVGAANRAGPYHLGAADAVLTVTFDLAQARGTSRSSMNTPTVVASAHACGNRTFVKSASACLDTTDVPVEGVLTVTDATGAKLLDHVRATGDFTIEGTRWKSARARLQIVAGADMVLLYGDIADKLPVQWAKIRSKGFAPGQATISLPGR